ncbi:MAG: FAD:protein FMN transferase [Pseudorhodobacter sp.]|nr:FAD:protein FMN transferase [Rhizobacter sp.]
MGKSEAPWLRYPAADRWAASGTLRRRAQPLLGTLVEVALQTDSHTAFEHASSAAFEVVNEVHRAMSFHDPLSDVRRISRAAAGDVLRVNPHTWNVLYLARRMELDSGGLFNAAVAPALVGRGLLPRPDGALIPVAQGLTDGLALLSQHRVHVLQPLWVDLGGIAKGYAVDCGVACLQALGVRAGLINAGGDMRAFGHIVHAVHLRFLGGLMRVASLQNGALASSSNAELSARKTPHIDPRCNRSACSASTVVVQACSAAVADALTKVALLCPATADRLCAAGQTEWQADWRPFLHASQHAH